MTGQLAGSAVLIGLAVTLAWAGARLALACPAPSPAAPRPARATARTGLLRAAAVVITMTVLLAVVTLTAAVHIRHHSLLGAYLAVAAVAGTAALARRPFTSPAARRAAVAGTCVLAVAWLLRPGWLTAGLLATVITVQMVPLISGDLAWPFTHLAGAGLALALAYDAVQVWATHQMTGGHIAGQWLPIMFYVPAHPALSSGPAQILGAGDIAIPAILLAAAARIAARAARPVIFYAALAAYTAGLTAACIVLWAGNGAALPATVFTIPPIAAAVFIACWQAGTVHALTAVPGTPIPAENQNDA